MVSFPSDPYVWWVDANMTGVFVDGKCDAIYISIYHTDGSVMLVGGLVAIFYFPIHIGVMSNHPN